MVPWWNTNFLAINRMIREFTAVLGSKGRAQYELIYQSKTLGAERQVLKLSVGQDVFALKLDTTAHETGRLKDEFALAEQLFVHFQDRAQTAVPKPIYMSPGGNFFASEYVGNRIASVPIRKEGDSDHIGQVFRRAGMWLHELHEFETHSTVRFWPNWMLEAVEEACRKGPHADQSDIARFRKTLEQDAAKLEGRSGLKAFCHGDFHASNLILGKGVTYGLDFTESGRKLALYDVVDFLKIDAFRESVTSDVDKSGVSRHCKEMFLRRYRHSVDEDVLDFCIRGRLLIDWATITDEQHARSSFQKHKFSRFKERLEIAFA